MTERRRNLIPKSKDAAVRDMSTTRGVRQGVFPGDIVLNPNVSNVRVVSLAVWEGGSTIIRIWPMLDMEDPANMLMPGRVNAEGVAGLYGMSLSEAVTQVTMAGIGPKTKGFEGSSLKYEPVTYIEARNRTKTYEGVTFYDLPYQTLYYACKRAKEQGYFGSKMAWNGAWNPIIDAKFPAMPAPAGRSYAIGHIIQNGSQFTLERDLQNVYKDGVSSKKAVARNGVPLGLGAEDPLIVIPLSFGALKSILSMCCREKPGHVGNVPGNPSAGYLFGDPCGVYRSETQSIEDPQSGVFFHLYNPAVHTFSGKHTSFNGTLPENGFSKYECGVTKTVPGRDGKPLSAAMSKADCEKIFARHLWMWKDSDSDAADSFLLFEPTIEERCVRLARAFKAVPELLRFGWMSHPEYLNYESVQAVLNNRNISLPTENGDDEESTEDVGITRPTRATGASAPRSSQAAQTAPAQQTQRPTQATDASQRQQTSRMQPRTQPTTAQSLIDEFDAMESGEPVVPTQPVKPTVQVRPTANRAAAPASVDEFDPAASVADDAGLISAEDLEQFIPDGFDDEVAPFEGAAEDNFGAGDEDMGVSDDFSDDPSAADDSQLTQSLATAKAVARSANRAGGGRR